MQEIWFVNFNRALSAVTLSDRKLKSSHLRKYYRPFLYRTLLTFFLSTRRPRPRRSKDYDSESLFEQAVKKAHREEKSKSSWSRKVV